jgi:hypothetical protein
VGSLLLVICDHFPFIEVKLEKFFPFLRAFYSFY